MTRSPIELFWTAKNKMNSTQCRRAPNAFMTMTMTMRVEAGMIHFNRFQWIFRRRRVIHFNGFQWIFRRKRNDKFQELAKTSACALPIREVTKCFGI